MKTIRNITTLQEYTKNVPHILLTVTSLIREQTLDLATGVSRLRVWEFGTVYSPHCGSLTLNLDTLNDF